eukprot:1166648_1
MAVVNKVNFVMPLRSPETIVSLLTSQIPSNTDEESAEANPAAQLLTVVNIAYEAPSLPAGHRWTIMIVVGRNCIPAIKSANTSSPSANTKGLKPKVKPLIRRTCMAERNPFNKVVAT